MPLWIRIARAWLPLAIAITVGAAGLYGVVQQVYRTGANDPQVQLAQDGAAAFEGGASPSDVVTRTVGVNQNVDISRTLGPFVIVFDASGKPVAASGLLNGEIPVPPVGVLDAARRPGGNVLTWAPQPDVRIAAVTVAAGTRGFVLVGRSLQDVEQREARLTEIVGIGWLVAMLASLVSASGLEWYAWRRRFLS